MVPAASRIWIRTGIHKADRPLATAEEREALGVEERGLLSVLLVATMQYSDQIFD